ncbi:MAG: hypothetical protein Q9220_005835 [cf. Caloplaca sp. 1 TL-2023]
MSSETSSSSTQSTAAVKSNTAGAAASDPKQVSKPGTEDQKKEGGEAAAHQKQTTSSSSEKGKGEQVQQQVQQKKMKKRPQGALTHLEYLQNRVKDIPAKERDQIIRLHMITWFGELRSRVVVLEDRIDVAKALEEAHDGKNGWCISASCEYMVCIDRDGADNMIRSGKPIYLYTSYLGSYLKKALKAVLVAIRELRVARSMIEGTPKNDIEDAEIIVDLLAVSATQLMESILTDDTQQVVMDQEQLDTLWKKVTDLGREIGIWKAGSDAELEHMLQELVEAFESPSEEDA